jgi:adenosylhomocysteine nucleosidase
MEPMRIVVTFAMASEFAPWRRVRGFQRKTLGTVEVFTSSVTGAEITAVVTGIGRERAGNALVSALRSAASQVHACISAGLAGALRPEVRIGDVVVARKVIGNLRNLAKSVGDRPCAPELVAAAEALGAKSAGAFLTLDHAVSKVEEKRELAARADAVEMESFDIMTTAHDYRIPAVAIRAISDGADEDLPLDMNRIFVEGRVSTPRVLGEVARHPGSIPGLVRLGHNSKKAAESLATFLDSYVKRLAINSSPSTESREPRIVGAAY